MPEPAEQLAAWARKVWPGGDPGPLDQESLAADGSTRLFVRLRHGPKSLVALWGGDNLAESRAWHYFAGHLAGLGLPVPRLLAAQPKLGMFLMEDLGRQSLQDRVGQAAGDHQIQAELYQPVLRILAQLQAKGALGLDTSYCFDGAQLDAQFLLEREVCYFLQHFVGGALGLASHQLPANLRAEMAEICRQAAQAGPWGLVHRDFQSRNLVLEGQRVGLVDFQGARLGPAQYDLAALLGDPYVDLDPALREQLLESYIQIRAELGGFDPERFQQGWPFVALCRAMQALGAYAFLTRWQGRPHFARYVEPGLKTLRLACAHSSLAGYPALQALAASLTLPPPENLALQRERRA